MNNECVCTFYVLTAEITSNKAQVVVGTSLNNTRVWGIVVCVAVLCSSDKFHSDTAFIGYKTETEYLNNLYINKMGVFCLLSRRSNFTTL